MILLAEIEAAWHYRRRPVLSRAWRLRSEGQPRVIVQPAWRAGTALAPALSPSGDGKRLPVAAVVRELLGVIGAAMTQRAKAA